MPPISSIVAILEDGFVRSYKKRSKYIAIDTGDLASTLVNYQASLIIRLAITKWSPALNI